MGICASSEANLHRVAPDLSIEVTEPAAAGPAPPGGSTSSSKTAGGASSMSNRITTPSETAKTPSAQKIGDRGTEGSSLSQVQLPVDFPSSSDEDRLSVVELVPAYKERLDAALASLLAANPLSASESENSQWENDRAAEEQSGEGGPKKMKVKDLTAGVGDKSGGSERMIAVDARSLHHVLAAVRQLLDHPAIQDLYAQEETTGVTMRGLLERMDSDDEEDGDSTGGKAPSEDRELAGFIMGRFASQQLVGEAAWMRHRRAGAKKEGRGAAAAARFRNGMMAMDRMVLAGRMFRSAKRQVSMSGGMASASAYHEGRRNSLQPPGAGATGIAGLTVPLAGDGASTDSGIQRRASSGEGQPTQAQAIYSESKDEAKPSDVRIGSALDATQRGRVSDVLRQVGSWELDVIELDQLLDGGALPLLGDILLRRNGFLDGGQPVGEMLSIAAIAEAGGAAAGLAMAGDRRVEELAGGKPLKHLGSRGSMREERTQTGVSRLSAGSGDDPLLLLNAEKVVPFLIALGEGYINSNPYHNRTHAADVMYTTHCLLQEPALVGILSQVRRVALLVGAALHDFKHPGYTNKLEISLMSDLAITYNDKSVYESMHLAESFRLMRENDRALDPFDTLEPVEYAEVRSHLVTSVLATDMTEHFTTVSKFEGKVLSILREQDRRGRSSSVTAMSIKAPGTSARLQLGNNESSSAAAPNLSPIPEGTTTARSRVSDASGLEDSRLQAGGQLPPATVERLVEHADLIMQVVLHASDISNPMKPLPVYQQWVDRVLEEFYRTGDKEKELGLSISPFCDRTRPTAGQCQVGFIDFVVRPIFDKLAKLLPAVGESFMACVGPNREHYVSVKNREEQRRSLAAAAAAAATPVRKPARGGYFERP